MSEACYYEGKKVRDSHEWYRNPHAIVCRQCGARKSEAGDWCCVRCGRSLFPKGSPFVCDPSKITCSDCQTRKPCKLPPEGWTCSRESGHEGPCAASPIPRAVRQAPTKTIQLIMDELGELKSKTQMVCDHLSGSLSVIQSIALYIRHKPECRVSDPRETNPVCTCGLEKVKVKVLKLCKEKI